MQKHKLFPAAFLNSKITTTISISLVLFLLGLVVFLSLFTKQLTDGVKESFSFDIVLQENTSKEDILRLQNQLNETTFAKSTEYIPKETAIQTLSGDLGYNPAAFLGVNPLPDVIVVHLNAEYAHPDSLSAIDEHLKGYSSNVKETEYRREAMQIVVENMTNVNIILLSIAVILLLISFALIHNTIRLMIYAKRFLIHTMQLVGAKKGFIIVPFMRSNIIQGVIAALMACGALYWLMLYISHNIPNFNVLEDTQLLLIVFGSVVILGVLITVIATYLAVNKYIRADIDDLHKM
ncbi:MAG: permease-like cell division protein FtsX [Dysgonamonadaceae bacterium]|jgi:cell division transport system permease protein|nr:permease-like cell division protein FtsX [Dysgonamonadaceae bacterium]